MRGKLTAFIFIFLLAAIGCNDNNPINPGKNIIKYLTDAGLEWEYRSMFILELYDSLGTIQSVDTLNLGNSVVKILTENDTLKNFTNLIEFNSFDVNSSNDISTDWYINADSGFYGIAYKNARASIPVIPKNQNLDALSKSFFSNAKKVLPLIPLVNNSTDSDSVNFFLIPKKILVYPLETGNKWIEFSSPFLKEK